MNATDLNGISSVTETTMSDEFVADLCRSYTKMLSYLSDHILEIKDEETREYLAAEKGSMDIGIGSVKMLMDKYLYDIVTELEIRLRNIWFEKDTIKKPLDIIHHDFKLWCQHTINKLEKLDYGIKCLYRGRTLSDALPGYDCKESYLYKHVEYQLSKMGFDNYAGYFPSFINEAIYALKQSVIDLENDEFLINGEKVENE